MRAAAKFLRAIGAIFVASILFAVAAWAQQPPPMPGKTAEQVYKNIQVLRGLPADLVFPEMRLFAGALGGNCEFCHVAGDTSKDDKITKRTARQMIVMVTTLNKTSFGGKTEVTCYTCHRGSSQPVTEAVLPTVERSPEELEEKPALPSVDAILTKYIQALGGETAIRKVTSRLIMGTQTIPTGGGGRISVSAQLERHIKAPNLLLNVYHTDKFTISDGFDGMSAWSQDAKGAVSSPGSFDLVRAKRNADLYAALKLKQEYGDLDVVQMEKVNNHDTYVLQASAQNSGVVEKLYFDVQTGLLLRTLMLQPTPLGNFPSEVDYDDYRDTGSGVKVPFLVSTTPALTSTALATTSTLRVEKVQDNVTIDDGKLVRPQPRGAPAQ
jgi:photosynthetic reaction center cytochrome c subunit